MNRNLLLAGGLVLVAGGLTYWYLSQNGEIRCSQHKTESECIAHNCFWYDGACHNDPPQHIPCADLGATCNVEGYTICDKWKNLCRCQDGEWICIQNQAPICFSGEEYYKCFNVGGYTSCLPVPGTLGDECWGLGYNCSCAVAECHETAFCDGRVDRCFKKAYGVSIAADNSNWEQCQATTNLPWCQCPDCSGRTCDFDIGELYTASTLQGTFGWEWCLWGSEFTLRIYGYLDGVGWTQIGEKMITSWGSEGQVDINLNFATQGLSKLRFACCDDLWINTKPKYFYGHLSY